MTAGREPLSAGRVVAAALQLIDEHGLAALSMRRLGDALGYEAMAIYKHIADKEALLDLVVSDVYGEMVAADVTLPPGDRLVHIAGELRRVACAHPHLFVRMITRPPGSPSVTAHIDATLQALRDGGLDEDDVVRSFWHFVNTTAGALLAETSALVGASTLEVVGAADASDCAALAQYGSALADCDFDAVYASGVEVAIAAVTS